MLRAHASLRLLKGIFCSKGGKKLKTNSKTQAYEHMPYYGTVEEDVLFLHLATQDDV
jgi:hypothetical protein